MNRYDLPGISSLGGHEFEDLIASLLAKMNFMVQQSKKTADGGIDMIAISKEPITGGTFIVQCKRYNHPISESIIRDLYGVITDQKASKGILITTSRFSPPAIEFSKNKPIELISGDDLIVLLNKYYGLDQNTNNIQMSYIEGYFWTNLIKVMSKTLKDFNDVISGISFQEGKVINDAKYWSKYIPSIGQSFYQNVKVLANIYMLSEQTIFNPSSDENTKMNEIRHLLDKFDETLNNMLIYFKELYFMSVPDITRNAHLAYVRFIKLGLINTMRMYSHQQEEFLKNPDKYKSPFRVPILELDKQETEAASKAVEEELAKATASLKRSNCFIATACYGYSSQEVKTLREFRDTRLLKSELGKVFVNYYYKMSPPVANIIQNNNALKMVTRLILKPLYCFAKISNNMNNKRIKVH